MALYRALVEAGQALGAGPVGSRALMSLRIEKGYGSWGREYGPEYYSQEAGLERLVKRDRAFLNKPAVTEVLARLARERLVLLQIDEDVVTASAADASGGEPIFQAGRGVGRVTSGAYGYSVGMSLALGYVKDVAAGSEVEVMHRARALEAPPFDPEGARLRA